MAHTRKAGRYLIPRLREKNDDDLVWGTNYNARHSEKNESTIFGRYAELAGFTERYKSNGYRKITLYSFRSFFFGLASDVHREGYAHKMIGHGEYLPQYDRMSDKKKLEWFLKLEPSLTVDQTKRDEEKIKKLEEENREKRNLSMKVAILTEENKSVMEELKKVVDDVGNFKQNTRLAIKKLVDDYRWEHADGDEIDDSAIDELFKFVNRN